MNRIARERNDDHFTRPGSHPAYKNIMVHLDGSSEDECRLAHAEALATRFAAHLTGLYTNMLFDAPMYGGEFALAALADLSEETHRQGDRAVITLTERFRRLNVPNDLRRIETFPNILEQKVASETRAADLLVASCPSSKPELERWRYLVEMALFDGNRGVYLVPPGNKPRDAVKSVLVGWVDTREAARAIAEALPLLVIASQVHLVTIAEPDKGRFGGTEAMADIAAHLHRHGVQVSVDALAASDKPAAVLLSKAHRVSADVLVTGAYGHSRIREWLLGGVTNDLIKIADIPLLMAH